MGTVFSGFELMRCPFCGGSASMCSQSVCLGHGEYITKFYIGCTKCLSRGPEFDTYSGRNENELRVSAVKGWNSRLLPNLTMATLKG